jgi:hypothetical protein
MSGGQLVVLGDTVPERVEAADSVIMCLTAARITTKWLVQKSVLHVAKGPSKRSNREGDFGTSPSIDQESVILAPDGITLRLLNTPAGVFGLLWPADDEIPSLSRTLAWGVLEADDLLRAIGLPSKHAGCRVGRLLLVRGKKYKGLTSRDLSAPRRLEEAVTGSGFDPTDPDSIRRIELLRRSAREQYDVLRQSQWPMFEDLIRAR